jgi:hypothetical protein
VNAHAARFVSRQRQRMLGLAANLNLSVDYLTSHHLNAAGSQQCLLELVAIDEHHSGLHSHALACLAVELDCALV